MSQVVCAVFVSEQRDSLCSFPTALHTRRVHGSFVPISLSAVFMSLCKALCLCGVAIPDSDAGSEDVLYQSPVGLSERAVVQTSFPERPDEMKPFLELFLYCGCGVRSPAQGRCNLQSKESVALIPFHLSPIDYERL